MTNLTRREFLRGALAVVGAGVGLVLIGWLADEEQERGIEKEDCESKAMSRLPIYNSFYRMPYSISIYKSAVFDRGSSYALKVR